MLKEFKQFLQNYGVIGLAIAVIIGGKLNEFVGSLVNDLIMPVVFQPLLRTAGVEEIAKLQFKGIFYGRVIGSGLNFFAVAIVVFYFSKLVLKEATVSKK
jgi:large conductance mechanosensitive channel